MKHEKRLLRFYYKKKKIEKKKIYMKNPYSFFFDFFERIIELFTTLQTLYLTFICGVLQ